MRIDRGQAWCTRSGSRRARRRFCCPGVQPFIEAPVPGVGNKAKGLGDGRRADEARIFFGHRAGGIAGGTQNAVGRVVKGHPLFLGLDPFLSLDHLVIDEIGFDESILVKEICLIDDQIALHRQIAQGFDGDRVAVLFRHIFDQGLAGQTVLAVDPHGIRAAYPMGAALAKAETAVLKPFDLHQGIEQAVRLAPPPLHIPENAVLYRYPD